MFRHFRVRPGCPAGRGSWFRLHPHKMYHGLCTSACFHCRNFRSFRRISLAAHMKNFYRTLGQEPAQVTHPWAFAYTAYTFAK